MIYVLVGYYSDRSGAYLLGAYNNALEATDRLAIAKSVQPALTVKCFPMLDDKAQLTDIHSDAGLASDRRE